MATILLVDDNDLVREALAQQLSAAGHVVTLASDGHEAMETLKSGTFDVVVTDIMMPMTDGIEFLISVRRASITVPVVAMTGSAIYRRLDDTGPGADYLKMASDLGATRTIRKPFTPKQLLALIDECLALNPGTRPGGG